MAEGVQLELRTDLGAPDTTQNTDNTAEGAVRAKSVPAYFFATGRSVRGTNPRP